jgi:hemoglobin-like flavoprotein
MTDRQLMLLKNSWSFMMIRSQDAETLFYLKISETVLFRMSLRSQLKEQAGRLFHMITLILTKFHHPDDILTEIKQVHEWKKRYGLREEDYALVGECLLFTIKKSLGETYTPETHEAWCCAFSVIRRSANSVQRPRDGSILKTSYAA